MEVIYIFEETKDPDMSIYKWQLPVKQSNITNTDWIHPRANYHCFDKNGFSLCGKYYQDIYYFETDIEYSDLKNKEELEKYKCKECRKIFSKLKDEGQIGENIGGNKGYHNR